MQTLQRLVVFAVLLVALVPLSTFALLDPAERHEAAQKLDQAIERAVGEYRVRRGRKVDPELVQKAQSEVQRIARDKREVRLELSSVSEPVRTLKDEFKIDVTKKPWKKVFESQGDDCFFCAVRDRITHTSAPRNLRDYLLTSLQKLHDKSFRERILRTRELKLISLLADAKTNLPNQESLEGELGVLRKEYALAESDLDRAKAGIAVGGGKTEEIKRVMEEVHAQVMRLQSELARIDARLRRKTERKLIEKGLMSPKPGEHSQGIVPYTPQFTWPAFGPISAGFLEPSYQRFFGIPHRGMDIVIAQGSPVVSAANGVAFLTKDGGPSGYSYVLIGHRGGYATLYGHLTHIAVHAGQDVSAGEIVGASGGRPGTRGAGPTTTGPHLHFEVIQGGVNVNPGSVLP